MNSLEFDYWFWNICIFLYFLGKNFLLAKLFKHKGLKIHPFFSLFMSIVTIIVNNNLLSEYQKYQVMSPIKGAIQFPPFTLLFLIADLISTIVLYIIIFARVGISFFHQPYAQKITELFRFIFLYIAFTYIVSTLWMGQLEKQMNFEYHCFKQQIEIDFAEYYVRNNRVPQKLADFTQYKTNPANNASLVYSQQTSIASALVIDEKGNKIMEGYQLIGLSHANNPEYRDYFDVYRINNKAICNGSLRIPDHDRNDNGRE